MSTLLKVSDAVNLAMHACAILATTPAVLISVKDLAKRLNASETTLSKAMQRLVKADLVVSTRGPKGGFRLLREPEQITLKEIVEAVEGPIVAPGCLFGRQICGREQCMLGDTVTSAHSILVRRLEETSLDKVLISLVQTSKQERPDPTTQQPGHQRQTPLKGATE